MSSLSSAATDLLPVIVNSTDSDLRPQECSDPYESGFLKYVITHISLSIAILGIPANILALIVLNYRVSNRSPTHILLTALAFEDILIIIFYTVYYVAIHYFEIYQIAWLGYLRHIDTPLFYLVNWTKMVEIYTVVILSLERYVAIRWPLKASRLCSVGRTKRGLCVIIVLSGIFKLPNLIFEYKVLKWNARCQDYRLERVFASSWWLPTFKLVYVQVLDQVCSFLIPLSLLVFLNFELILRIRRFTKRHTHGHWTSGRVVISKNSNNSNALYQEPTQLTSNKAGYAEKNFIVRNPTFHKSFRLRRNQSSRSLRVFVSDHSNSNEDVSMVHLNSEFPGTGNTSADARHRGLNSNNRSVLLTLVGVVTVFLICETPTTVCFIFEIVNLIYRLCKQTYIDVEESMNTEQLYYYAYPAALCLVLLGCASNFFIYILIGRRFRRNCKQLFIHMGYKLCCWTDRTKKTTESGFIRPLKHLRRSKVKRSGLMVRSGRSLGMKTEKVDWSTARKKEAAQQQPESTINIEANNADVLLLHP